ncbi:RagB/SusD family nutrient uptake outer membrane protein [Filimonas effusa]|uniref:RagB/SusD family nutrient uptake outer membrane protein n=1 Tax=Filimonas effusa TaxID=2508721 RepID=A0A4Q1D0D0_9BACT|nr:RagB/SusD family nutrient uptake outer membrane protein [Filimonas effusa]RXK81194.1 RagB/SusD family nutrient uptake outer membrane protein [Filimonas effusa]
MKRKIFIYIGIVLAVASASCRKYVEIPIEGRRVLENTEDYASLLYNPNNMLRSYSYPIYAGDDVGSDNDTWQNGIANNSNGRAYSWASEIMLNAAQEDNDWTNLYYSIYVTNLAIVNVMDSKNGTDAQKRKVLAQALVNRAFYYLTLVNIYAKQYDAATAATDPGVPMRLDDLVTGSLDRKSVQTVYNQILADLNQALSISELPNVGDYTTDASKAAGYALLARTYLNMRNFTEAKKAAESALSLQSGLLDLNNYISGFTNYPQRHVDPEVILCKIAGPIGAMPVSNAQLTLFADSVDLRYKVLIKPGSFAGTYNAYLPYIYVKANIANQGYMSGPTVPEMFLIKAECEARANDAGAAVTTLNTLRKKRFTAADYRDLTAANGTAALQLALLERRRELMGSGMRWFDQRRLTKDGLTPTITRVLKGTTYTLEPGSNRYTFAIAQKYIDLNPEITQNPR